MTAYDLDTWRQKVWNLDAKGVGVLSGNQVGIGPSKDWECLVENIAPRTVSQIVVLGFPD